MNTLSTNSIQSILHSFKEFSSAAQKLTDSGTVFPVNVTGLNGSLHSYFLKEFAGASYAKWIQSYKYTASGYSSKAVQGENLPENNGLSASRNIVVIVPGEREALALRTDLNTVFEEAQVFILPSWGTLTYRPATPGTITFGQRAGVFARMAFRETSAADAMKFAPRIFIIPQRVMQTPAPSPEYIKSLCFSLSVGQQIDTVKTAEKLTSIGYTRVPRVSVRGEFSLRGEVLDIFLPESEDAMRIIFDFDTIEKIKTFDAENQTTSSSVNSVLIYPMKEVIWNETLIEKLEEKLSDSETVAAEKTNENQLSETENAPRLAFTEEAKKAREKLLEELKTTGQSEGEELFYPALWDKNYTIFDYISPDTPVFMLDFDRLLNSQESNDREFMGMYRKARLEFPVLPPQDISFRFADIINNIKRCIKFRTLITEKSDNFTETVFELNSDASQSYFGNINYLKEDFTRLQNDGWSLFIFADNQNQALRITEILKPFTQPENDGSTAKKKPLAVFGKAISEGFIIPEIKLRVIQENEIFGRKKYVPKSLNKAKSSVIDTFVELNPGDYIVHVQYGIGIFRGIDRVKALGNERDYIKLEYADEEFVFVPIEQVNLVQRYIGNEGEAPRIDRIGSKSWEARKNKVRTAVEDLAKKLIDLYSRRKAAHGFPFPKDTEWQTMFEAAFPYEDTPDQVTVTEEIKRDMEKPVPMDRLVCGDVGYGKTEIAMRAAFKAVMGGKQVAFLAPTTILAEQHYETCMERFKTFPVKIAHLSRFVAPAEQKKILKKAAEGQIDILVGTHRIIQKDVAFKNLGLMIIDEEQRFGVKDKEKLKVLKNNIDSLAMSATPIPRTLHMSLLKIRDMSLLTTPPQSRQPIETVIDAYSDERVAAAIRKEVERGGQVFYLHNRVESLAETRIKLERLLPEMMIDTAHGQMTSDELDDIFRRFKMGGFHVLVATTIIENGIDIPNVNTIIIDRADMYGVSQLYQLRGRVGRSDRKAYAYLLYPGNKSLSEIAMKRLQVISDFTELGSGFKIAMKDMEIRGAGNLLGKDQSGNVYSVGFDMYVRLLNDAVNRLTAQEDYQSPAEVLMELEYTGFIPDSYVQNPQTKMEIYKKIAGVQNAEELDSVYTEMTDRFGPVPEEVSSLLSLAQIRIICRKLNIASIKEHNGIAAIEFAKVSDISVNKVLRLIAESAGAVKLNPSKPNMIFLNTGKIGLKEKSEFIREKLEKII